MTDIQEKVLNMIQEGKTAREISQALNVSTKQLINILQSLRNNGYNYLNKRFSINGEIKLKSTDNFINRDKIIKLEDYPSKMDFLLISDTHLGSKHDRIDLLDKTYNYAEKNNIKTIFHLGDVINGVNTQEDSKNKSIDTQLQYFLKKYPCSENIITYIIKGNHDYNGIDIQSFIEANRLDIIVFPSLYQILKIGNDKIVFTHNKYKTVKPYGCKIYISGHSHKYKTISSPSSLNITVPSISDIKINDALESGIVRMELIMTDDFIAKANLTHSIFLPEITTCSEQSYTFEKQKN